MKHFQSKSEITKQRLSFGGKILHLGQNVLASQKKRKENEMQQLVINKHVLLNPYHE